MTEEDLTSIVKETLNHKQVVQRSNPYKNSTISLCAQGILLVNGKYELRIMKSWLEELLFGDFNL
jgi:pSer/pThr/pTyr-binding forkhead associated (FHA) protein